MSVQGVRLSLVSQQEPKETAGSRARDVPPLLQRLSSRAQGGLRATRRDDLPDRAASQGQDREGHQPLRTGHPQPHPPERRGHPDKAFQAFFRRVKAGENPGYPRFKVRNRFAGFGFKEDGNGFKIDGRRLYLFGIGRIAVRWHRKLEGTIKTARIFCRAGKWFVAFSCEVEKPEPLPRTGESIGIDLGLMRLATFSNGEKKENPRWYRGILRELRALQRKIARCVMGSRNRRRLIGRLQRLMVHVTNARKDFLNKFVHELVTRFDRIVLEDLRVAAMVPGRFAMSILDAGWSYLVSRLAHKAESAGREVVKVDPAYTSKTCSDCGARFEHLTLWDRWVECDCGVSLDRDHNAAINVFQRGGNEPLGAKLGNGRVCPEAAPL